MGAWVFAVVGAAACVSCVSSLAVSSFASSSKAATGGGPGSDASAGTPAVAAASAAPSKPAAGATKPSSSRKTPTTSPKSEHSNEVVSGSKAPPPAGTKPGQVSACPSWVAPNPNPAADTDVKVARAKAAGRSDVVFLGDSITALLDTSGLIPKKYAPTLPAGKRKVTMLGVGGDVIENVAWRICQPASFPRASVYVVCIGTNNVLAPPATIAERHKTLLEFLRTAEPRAHVFFLSLFLRTEGGAPRDAAVREVNANLKKMVRASDSRVHYASWPYDLTKPEDLPDGLHPNDAGWTKVLDRLVPYVSTLL